MNILYHLNSEGPRDSTCRKWSGHLYVRGVVTTGPEPRAFLDVSADELRITGLLDQFHFYRDEIVSITRTGWFPWGRRALRIEHRVQIFPPVILFYPLCARSADIETALRDLGYPARTGVTYSEGGSNRPLHPS